MIDPAFWRGKKVFVTGHTGFKGGWLVSWLNRLGAEVIGYSLPPSTQPSMFEEVHLAERTVSLEGDVRDLDALKGALREHAPDIVIHLAAQALVKTAYSDPVTTFTTNVMGTMNILEAVRESESVRAVVCITSDKCYKNVGWVWGYRENDELGGHDPYSGSKGCAELVIRSYRESFFPMEKLAEHGVLIASARAGNVIGGGDWSPDRIVPDTVKAVAAGEAVAVRAPKAIRPWQFVLEPLRGYLRLAEGLWKRDETCVGAWNFGPEIVESKPVEWVVDYLTREWGEGARWTLDDRIHPPEDHFLKLDCAKAKSLLQWSPALELSTVLDWVVDWYRRYYAGDDPTAITDEQIARYESLFHS